MIIFDIEQRSEAWHAARAGRVTGTRFKSLMAKETTQTYRDLAYDLAAEIITGKTEEGYVSEAMQNGIDTEPIARAEYIATVGVDVVEAGFVILGEGAKYYDWIGVSPDGLIGEDGLLEIKCPLPKTHLKYIDAGRLPAEYRYQAQGQLFVTGRAYCDFMSFVEGMQPFILRVYPDNELFAEYERRLDILISEVKSILEKYNTYNIYE
jgi:putative phage-type endonuclease